MYRSRLWLLLTLLLFALPGALTAQESDVLTGKVTGVDGAPIVGARVEAISVETEITRSVLTDANGRYMILFPDGGGRYVLRVSFIGMGTEVRVVVREGAEELLVSNFTLSPAAIQLEGITAQARSVPSRNADTGEQSTDFSQDLVNRLPLPDLDPTTLALLAAGVVATELDSLSGQMGFSVAGMSELLNQIVLDGVILGEDGLGVPEEGIRRTQVTTSTFDVSRGGFAGGQVRMTTARGNNRPAGSFSYRLDDDALQINSAAITNGFTRHNMGGSWGGPIIRNRLFYNGAFQLSRNINRRYALASNDPLASLRTGVHNDSIGRFLSIMEDQYGFSTLGQTGRYNQLSDDIRLQGRIDWNISRSQRQSHTLSARFNINVNGQDSTRISTMDLAQHGGETERNNRLGAMTLTSRFGGNWTNTLGISYSHSWNDALPYVEMPEGRVRITSEFEDGTRGTRTLIFGGNRSMPSEAYSRNLQISEDLSLLVPLGSHLHRFKVGGTVLRVRDSRRSTDNLFGTFTYASLEDFEANRPERFERALTEREAKTGRLNAGVYIGDTWRISHPLELTFGIRWDYSRLDERPEYNPKVEALFGRRTDVKTAASGFSPRLGFNLRLNKSGEAPRSLNGGIGYFAGTAPTNIYSTAVRQTGLPNADQRLICIGDAVPTPDWDGYIGNIDAIPTSCADGGSGSSSYSLRAPNVTLINPDQSLPTSLRAELGYRTALPFNLNGEFRYGYSRGIGLWGYRDLNLKESKTFILGNEDRIFYGDPAAIVTSTGNVSMATSRKFGDFGLVYDVSSNLRSETHQFIAKVNGMVSRKSLVSVNYTLGYSREETTGFMGGSTAGNPNETFWSVGRNDRRHTLNVVFSYAFTPEFEFALTGRSTSGAPFTPLVNRDINGDGVRNDQAFIFSPDNAPTPEVAEGMARLLEVVPDRIRDCLESQMNTIAKRNSCRNGWTYSLDFRASLRPNLPRLQRRMTISIDGRNTLTGLDQLFHGRYNMKGWGEGRRADANLLEVRGFDPVSKSFIYEVNEGFGQTTRGPNALRSPFSLTLSARVLIGGQPSIANRGFGAIPSSGGSGGRGGAGGRQGGGGGSRGSGVPLSGLGEFASIFRNATRGPVNVDSAVTAALYNPIPRIVSRRDSLGLNADEVNAIRAISDSLAQQLKERKTQVLPIVDRYVTTVRSNGGANGGQIRLSQELVQQAQRELQAHIDGYRQEIKVALEAVQRILGEERWNKLPEHYRTGRRSPPRGSSFNAVGLLDRMLVNPVPVIIDMRESLALTDQQVGQLKELSEKLQTVLNKRREELGRQFDNLSPQQQQRRFEELQPEINKARSEITNALQQVQKILSKEQWDKLPDRVKNPFQGNQRQQQTSRRPTP